MLSTTAWTAAVTRAAFVTSGSKRSVSFRSSGTMLTLSTPSIFLQPVTTCDAQELHMSADISSVTSSRSVATAAAGARGALPGVNAGEPHPTIAASNRKGAKRTV